MHSLVHSTQHINLNTDLLFSSGGARKEIDHVLLGGRWKFHNSIISDFTYKGNRKHHIVKYCMPSMNYCNHHFSSDGTQVREVKYGT